MLTSLFVKYRKEGKDYPTKFLVGLIVSGIMTILIVVFTFALKDYYKDTLGQTYKYELAYESRIAIEKVNMKSLDTEGYHIFNINNLDISTTQTLESYKGYIVVDNTSYAKKIYVFIHSNVAEVVKYDYYELGSLGNNIDYVKPYSNKDYTKEEICSMMNVETCIYED